jgi:hypothetical protein
MGYSTPFEFFPIKSALARSVIESIAGHALPVHQDGKYPRSPGSAMAFTQRGTEPHLLESASRLRFTTCSTTRSLVVYKERVTKMRMTNLKLNNKAEDDDRITPPISRFAVSPSSRRSSSFSFSISNRYDPAVEHSQSAVSRPRGGGLRRSNGGFYAENSNNASSKNSSELAHDADEESSGPSAAASVRMQTIDTSPNSSASLCSSDDAPRPAAALVAVAPVAPVKPLCASGQSESLGLQVEEQNRSNLVGVIACTLEQLCPPIGRIPSDPHFLSLFHSSALPGISIRDYLVRLSSYTRVSDEALIQTAIHIGRLARNGAAEKRKMTLMNSSLTELSLRLLSRPHPRINGFSPQPFEVSIHNIHRLLLSALLTTAKLTDDFFFNNHVYATLGGISLEELNRLEREFLQILDYRTVIEVDEFLLEYAMMNDQARHGTWCQHGAHPLGPSILVHPEDPQIALDSNVLSLQQEKEHPGADRKHEIGSAATLTFAVNSSSSPSPPSPSSTSTDMDVDVTASRLISGRRASSPQLRA